VSAGMNFIPTFYPKVKYLIIFARLLKIKSSPRFCLGQVRITRIKRTNASCISPIIRGTRHICKPQK